MKHKLAASKHAGPIMCAIGTAISLGGYAATYFGTRKSSEILIEHFKDTHPGQEVPSNIFTRYTFKDRIKLTWKAYVVSGVCAATGTGLIIGGQATTEKRAAVISSMLKTTQKELALQKEETAKAVGEEKAAEIDKAVEEKKEKEDQKTVESMGNKKILIVDGLTTIRVYDSWRNVRKKIDYMNSKLSDGSWDMLTYDEYIGELGFEDNESYSESPQEATNMAWGPDNLIQVYAQPRLNHMTGEMYLFLYHHHLPDCI